MSFNNKNKADACIAVLENAVGIYGVIFVQSYV